MIGLPNRITCIGIVVRTPEQTGLERSHLSVQIFRVACERRVRGFMNYADDALAFHRAKIRTHHVVMRHVYDARGAKSTRWNKKSSSTSASRNSISASW